MRAKSPRAAGRRAAGPAAAGALLLVVRSGGAREAARSCYGPRRPGGAAGQQAGGPASVDVAKRVLWSI
eukprot:COSAG03_NODE_5934_length_1145_cov_2.016252_1_plen_68_part_10